MSQNIFIGVDGGGTKSKVRIEDEIGNVLGQAVAGPANVRLSVDGAWQSIYTAIEEALVPADIVLDNQHYHFHIGLGLAGCEVNEAREAFLNRPHPFKTIELVSDAHVACIGAHSGKEGAIIVVGTGVVGYQIQNNRTTKVGGWGFPHDDIGGGAWLGLEAVKLTFQWLDHRTEKSPLVEDVFAFFNKDLDHFVTWANQANSKEFARLAPLVINHSQQEEVAAVRLMKKAAHAVDRIHHVLVKLRSDDQAIFPTCLIGGIAPFIETWISEELRSSLVQRQAGASAGAVTMIRQAVSNQFKVMQA